MMWTCIQEGVASNAYDNQGISRWDVMEPVSLERILSRLPKEQPNRFLLFLQAPNRFEEIQKYIMRCHVI